MFFSLLVCLLDLPSAFSVQAKQVSSVIEMGHKKPPGLQENGSWGNTGAQRQYVQGR